MGDQTHQLFASQLECKEFIQQAESGGDDTAGSNSSHLQDKAIHITTHTPNKRKSGGRQNQLVLHQDEFFIK